jgi:hypothetical protein
VTGEIADWPVAGAWQPAGDGRRYFLLGKRLLRDARLKVGDLVEMRFAIADQDAVDMPDALAEALEDRADLAAAWSQLTPGAQRAFAHRVASARAEATIARRVEEVAGMVLRGERPGPPAAKRRRKAG